MTQTDNRCGIYIDIEGASSIYKENELKFYQSLDTFLSSALEISRIQFHRNSNRLFLHQMGADGLFIISDFGYDSYEIPISISIFLMRRLLSGGGVGKCGISLGNYADIRSCLPETKRRVESLSRDHQSGGFMTRVNIMGTALINAYRTANIEPNGGRLAVDRIAEALIPSGLVRHDQYEEIILIDWIHSESPILDDIYDSVNEPKPEISQLEDLLISYVSTNATLARRNWGDNTLSLNGCKR